MADPQENIGGHLTFDIHGEVMTADQYMERHGVEYFRAIHEINAIVNAAAVPRPGEAPRCKHIQVDLRRYVAELDQGDLFNG